MRAFILTIALALPSAAASASEAPILAARHEGRLGAGRIEWRTTLVAGEQLTASERIALAVPLPPEVSLMPGTGVELERDAQGRVVALLTRPEAWRASPPVRVLAIELAQDRVRPGERIRLGAPIVGGVAIQGVRLEGGDGARFEPDPELGLELHVGYAIAPDVNAAARERYAELLGSERAGAEPIYLTGGPPIARAGGVFGRVSLWRDRAAPAYAALGALFVALGGALSIVYRRLGRRAERERAEALLIAELEGLDGSP